MVKETVREPNIKKRRKNSSSISEAPRPDEDIYKKIVEFEENEAANRSPEEDVELYFSTCKTIREHLSDIARLKLLGTTEAKTEISEKQIEICLLFAVLKKLNRLEKFRTKTGRDALHQEKLRTDSTKLQLQNLLYELTYLKKEIAKCFQFRSLDEEIDLIPVEQFFKEAPETISKTELTKKDPHQLQLARLEWELQQRKELASQCHQLETEKEKVAAEIVSKQERLEKLAPKLVHILEVIKPLQDHLGLPNDMMRQEHQLAYLLPNSLYLLYAKVDAYTQVYDKNTTVHILGEEDEARQLKEDLETQDVSADSDSDPESDPTEENSNDRQKRHHRKSTREQQQQDKCNKLLASHPLSIQIKMKLDKDNKYNLILNFHYKIKLQVVTVKCQVNKPQTVTLGVASSEVLSSENLLRELFPNDLGEESPNSINHYQLRQLELGSFSSLLDQLGHPYLWAQRICGLDFIPGQINSESLKASSELSQSSIESVMKALSYRFRSRIALSSQMHELENNMVPMIHGDLNVPLKLNSTVNQWQSIGWQEYCESASTEKFQQFVTSTDMLYKLTIVRGSAKLIALVAIKNNYPEEKPLFSISVQWKGVYHGGNCDAVRDMERAINTDWTLENKRGYSVWLLSAQVRKLLACFDIYLEVASPDEFVPDKIFFKPTRGINRRRPYKYLKIGGGVFTQY